MIEVAIAEDTTTPYDKLTSRDSDEDQTAKNSKFSEIADAIRPVPQKKLDGASFHTRLSPPLAKKTLLLKEKADRARGKFTVRRPIVDPIYLKIRLNFHLGTTCG